MITVHLTKEKCYCDLFSFYENVAKELDIFVSDDISFDCTAICVSKPVQEAIFKFYRDNYLHSATDVAMGTLWLQFGPKANLAGEDYLAEIGDNFIG